MQRHSRIQILEQLHCLAKTECIVLQIKTVLNSAMLSPTKLLRAQILPHDLLLRLCVNVINKPVATS